MAPSLSRNFTRDNTFKADVSSRTSIAAARASSALSARLLLACCLVGLATASLPSSSSPDAAPVRAMVRVRWAYVIADFIACMSLFPIISGRKPATHWPDLCRNTARATQSPSTSSGWTVMASPCSAQGSVTLARTSTMVEYIDLKCGFFPLCLMAVIFD